MGSKSRIAKEILPIVLKDRTDEWYVEPFAGGMNTICEVSGNRIANDINFYLIKMWDSICKGWVPAEITKEEYQDIKNNFHKYSPDLIGWAGFNCSYSGKWFGGYAGKTKTKINTIRDYQKEALNNVLAQKDKLQGVRFTNQHYAELDLPPNSIIYCDPPYKGTTGYFVDFDHEHFWNWIRKMTVEGHKVYISEYQAPDDFVCVWEKEVKSSLSANGKIGGSKISTEKLFTLK